MSRAQGDKRSGPFGLHAAGPQSGKASTEHGSIGWRLLQLAGRYSAPQYRKGTRFFAPKAGLSQQRIGEIAHSALGRRRGALSGVAAARVYFGHAPDPGPVVAWTTDIDAVAERISATLREVDEYQRTGRVTRVTGPSATRSPATPPAR
ncbi:MULTISPECIES: hypothetical protein [Bacteria]|uniref:hypothetical protein n=1 Tax=Bacteria TaxID=2 RepID=UPI003C7BA9F3